MTSLTDHLRNVCISKEFDLRCGEKYPSYIINRYFSFISPIHNTIISSFVNTQVDYYSDQDLFEITKQFIPKIKYNWSIFGGYKSLPKKEIDPRFKQKVELVSKIFGVSFRESKMMLEKSDFNEEVENLIKKV